MNDLDRVADRVSSALRDLRVAPPKSAQDTSRAARAIGARLRTRRRRFVVGTTACVVAVAAVGVTTAGLLTHGRQSPNTAAVLPADQPVCPAELPTGDRPGGLLTGTSPTPTLATGCEYDPETKQLRNLIGQFRPVDIPDFLTFVRGLPDVPASECAGGAPVAAASIQFLLPDKTARSLTVVSSARCVTLSDGSIDTVVPIASLGGSGAVPWAQIIDPALPTPPVTASPDTNDEPVYITPTAETSMPSGSQTRTSQR